MRSQTRGPDLKPQSVKAEAVVMHLVRECRKCNRDGLPALVIFPEGSNYAKQTGNELNPLSRIGSPTSGNFPLPERLRRLPLEPSNVLSLLISHTRVLCFVTSTFNMDFEKRQSVQHCCSLFKGLVHTLYIVLIFLENLRKPKLYNSNLKSVY